MQSFYNGLVESQQLATNWIDNTVAAYVEDAAPAALGGYELSGLLWAGSAGSGLALAALAALGGSGLSWAGYGRLWAALLEREILALWKNQKRQILALWKNPFLTLWKNNSRPP